MLHSSNPTQAKCVQTVCRVDYKCNAKTEYIDAYLDTRLHIFLHLRKPISIRFGPDRGVYFIWSNCRLSIEVADHYVPWFNRIMPPSAKYIGIFTLAIQMHEIRRSISKLSRINKAPLLHWSIWSSHVSDYHILSIHSRLTQSQAHSPALSSQHSQVV